MTPPDDELLSARTVATYLVHRGLLGEDERPEVAELAGGVSNIVLAVRGRNRRLVVKQALPRLRVAEEWLAERTRSVSEAEALRVAAELTAGAAPAVVDLDRERCVLTIAEAPAGWRNWKEELLAGRADPPIAARLGDVLGVWHRETWDDTSLARRFPLRPFEQLRVDPYHRTVMRRHPDLAALVGRYVDELMSDLRCLVHGDYSPKNVLLGDGEVWVLDFEVAHFGAPAFDPAFMLNHLMLKAIHRPADRAGYAACAHAFWDAYATALGAERAPSAARVLGHLGCLMVARIDGKSPVEYLTSDGARRARAFGRDLLADPPKTLTDGWRHLEGLAA